MEFLEAVDLRLMLRVLGTLAAAYVANSVSKWLYQGYTLRKRVQGLKAQGVSMLPHSWIFGHLLVMGEFRKEHPPDVNIYELFPWLLNNIERFFPGEKVLPPIIYLDIWPAAAPLMLSTHPAVSAQFTQLTNLPKSKLITNYMKPLTGITDIVSVHGQVWKTWRSRFNPGFSSRNVTALLPELVEEALVFVQGLKKLAGEDGAWGPVFQLEEKTTNLTFDVIVRATTGSRLNEQSRVSSSPFKLAFFDQMIQMGKVANAARGLVHSFIPTGRSAVDKNNRVLHDVLMPKVHDRIASGAQPGKTQTIVDLALRQFEVESTGGKGAQPDAKFLDILLSNLKVFIFAGHDTTATTICWMFKRLGDNPDILARMRAEHTALLGPNAEGAHEVILASPHLLYALPYTLAVIKETLRMYPLAGTLRDGTADYFLTIPGSSFQYPTEGFAMWDGVLAVQTRPDLWPQASEFIPERWLVPVDDPLYPYKDAWRPFSMGLRNCIGQELALTELRLVAVLVVRSFDIEEAWSEWDLKQGNTGPQPMVNGERLYLVGNGTVHPKDSMPVHVRLRHGG